MAFVGIIECEGIFGGVTRRFEAKGISDHFSKEKKTFERCGKSGGKLSTVVSCHLIVN
jgi:hypothetical protein